MDTIDSQSNLIEVNFGRSVKSDLSSIPIVQQAMFLLNEIKNQNGLKLTERGFLPRKFVHKFWSEFLKGDLPSFLPNREADCPELHRLNFLLTESGYFKIKSKKVYLSKRGEQILAQDQTQALYQDLFRSMITKYNWGYDDRYGIGWADEEFDQFQYLSAGIVEMIIEKRLPQLSPEWLIEEVFGYKVHDKFSEESTFHEEEPIRCFKIRFFDRFCIPFGLLKKFEKKVRLLDPLDTIYRPTSFLTNHWRSLVF